MAKCTNITTLKYHKSSDTSSTFAQLVKITEYPDLGGPSEKLDATTLSDTKTRKINGIQDSADLEFSAWYTKEDYATLAGLKDTMCVFQLEFGEDGEDGIFQWEGQLEVYPVGAGVNEVRQMSFSISDEGDEPIHLVTA